MTSPLRRRLPVLSAVVVTLLVPVAFALATEETPVVGRAEGPPPRPGTSRPSRPVRGQAFRTTGSAPSRVHLSDWEPRPDNQSANLHMPPAAQVKESLARRPRAAQKGYDPRWDTWLLPRVTGHHTGTTDENIQWAACKWGLSDNLLRAIAFRESDWYQYEVYSDGTLRGGARVRGPRHPGDAGHAAASAGRWRAPASTTSTPWVRAAARRPSPSSA